MYGNMKATDFEVRKSALQANCLQFIESKIEELEGGEKIEKMRKDIESKIQ